MIKITAVIAVLMPTRAIGGNTASTVFAITGNEPNNSCAGINAKKAEFDLSVFSGSKFLGEHQSRLFQHVFECL